MSRPKVSVIVPNYNHAKYLRRRIDSILGQSYQDFELLILDDNSSDNSLSVIAEYADHPKIRTMFNVENSGNTFRQWNKGISAASGEYVWLAESDDFADPMFLERLVAVLDENLDVGIAYCESNIVNDI